MRTDIPGDMEKTQAYPGSLDEYLEKERREHRSSVAGCDRNPIATRPMSTAEILAELFSYHAPTDATIPKHAAINQAAKNFAEVVLANCPRRGNDFSRTIQLIQDARMTANRLIALNGLSL